MSFQKPDQVVEPTPVVPVTTIDNADYLTIGDRTFKSAEEVQTHFEASQEHIAKLEGENKDLREKVAPVEQAAVEAASIQDVLDKLKQVATPAAPETPAVSMDELVSQAVNMATTRVEENMKTQATQQLENDNLTTSTTAAKAAYGEDKFMETIQKIGMELGLTDPAQIDNLAKQSPALFKRVFLPVQPTTVGGPSESSINMAARAAPTGPTKSFMKTQSMKTRADIMQSLITEASNK